MSFLDRIAGGPGNPKISPWRAMHQMWQVEEGFKTIIEAKDYLDLNADEGDQFEAIFDELKTTNPNQKAEMHLKAWHLFIGMEEGQLTEAEILTYLGI